MPWTEITRVEYQRNGLRYTSDLTDREWALIARQMPPRRRLGRPREVDLREVVQAILYILSTGCQWRALPKEFPPYSTVQGYFYAWRDTGRWQKIVKRLVRRARQQLGRKPSPTAAVIDSQSAPTTQAGGARGYDPGKRICGRKRHIVTDTDGLLLAVHVHPANVQDCHGAVPVLERLRRRFPKLHHVFADRVYRGEQLLKALAHCKPWTIEIVQRPHGVKGFQLLPRRWVVERTFAWCGRCRRLAKDFEGSAATETAWILVAHLRLLTRRLACPKTFSAF
ncbi:IS5 family transposase [Bradyrhizobium sp. C9]|uniref:IS5 family transposase n=1 Tax=Bradyrhizobium sp. C9 TaxID=142585 RepID=UPI000BE8B29C|nr:IS5 family transposase [Bradyrhizobium sp. C9]PDT73116.1 IS5/IS1182 family transposase [Bradyrhizobium sp. C9]